MKNEHCIERIWSVNPTIVWGVIEVWEAHGWKRMSQSNSNGCTDVYFVRERA